MIERRAHDAKSKRRILSACRVYLAKRSTDNDGLFLSSWNHMHSYVVHGVCALQSSKSASGHRNHSLNCHMITICSSPNSGVVTDHGVHSLNSYVQQEFTIVWLYGILPHKKQGPRAWTTGIDPDELEEDRCELTKPASLVVGLPVCNWALDLPS